MEHGNLSRLQLRMGARLLDSIKSLGRHRLKGDEVMSELIAEAEQLGIDLIRGRMPLITVLRTSELLKGIAQYKNAECRTVEYGISADCITRTMDALRRDRSDSAERSSDD
jgi:hypothetical protein